MVTVKRVRAIYEIFRWTQRNSHSTLVYHFKAVLMNNSAYICLEGDNTHFFFRFFRTIKGFRIVMISDKKITFPLLRKIIVFSLWCRKYAYNPVFEHSANNLILQQYPLYKTKYISFTLVLCVSFKI